MRWGAREGSPRVTPTANTRGRTLHTLSLLHYPEAPPHPGRTSLRKQVQELATQLRWYSTCLRCRESWVWFPALPRNRWGSTAVLPEEIRAVLGCVADGSAGETDESRWRFRIKGRKSGTAQAQLSTPAKSTSDHIHVDLHICVYWSPSQESH